MTRTSATEAASISVNFSVAEKNTLTRRARMGGQTLNEYIRERVLTEAGCEEQVLRFLMDELTRVADENRQAVAEEKAKAKASANKSQESREAKTARIAKEMRESFTQAELDAGARVLKIAFDPRPWPQS